MVKWLHGVSCTPYFLQLIGSSTKNNLISALPRHILSSRYLNEAFSLTKFELSEWVVIRLIEPFVPQNISGGNSRIFIAVENLNDHILRLR